MLAIQKYCFGYTWFGIELLGWPAIFIFLAWIVIFIPVLWATKERKIFWDIRFSWFSWSLLAVIAYTILVMSWLPVANLLWFPAVVGLTAGISYSILISRNIAPAVLFFLPIIVVTIYQFVLWPIAQKYFTKYAYLLGTPKEKKEMEYGIVRKIKVGMRFDDLNKLLPQRFNKPFDSFSSYGGDGKSYRIDFDGQIISKIEIKE